MLSLSLEPSADHSCTGPPGAGKGTQCAPLAQNLGILHYSAGDLLRQEQKERSSWWRGDWIAAHRADRTGVPVPHEVYLEILRDRIYQDIKSGRKMFLIDGFPRNVEHDRLFAKYVRSAHSGKKQTDNSPSTLMSKP